MSSLTKIAFAAVLAYTVQGSAADGAKFNRLLSRANSGRSAQGGLGRKKGVFNDDEAFFKGKCCVKDADGNKKGIVIFHQGLDDEGVAEATSISAHVRGAAADRA